MEKNLSKSTSGHYMYMIKIHQHRKATLNIRKQLRRLNLLKGLGHQVDKFFKGL